MPKNRKKYQSHRGSNRPIAAVYRGPVSSEGCSESLADLLRRSSMRFEVHYLGPGERDDICENTLRVIDLLAWPGGGDDQATDFLQISHYTPFIQKFIHDGGLYAGICLGAFFARGSGGDYPRPSKPLNSNSTSTIDSDETFFGLFPAGSYVSSERFEEGAEVKGDEDTIIRTDWTFGSGEKKGKIELGRWQYFQDGGRIHLGDDIIDKATILGRYSATQNPCATITPYGKGHVGLIGVHPEADGSWYADWGGRNPDGVRFDLGDDFLRTLWEKKTVFNDWLSSPS